MMLRGYGVVFITLCGISITVSRDFVQYMIPHWNDMDNHDEKDGFRFRFDIRLLSHMRP